MSKNIRKNIQNQILETKNVVIYARYSSCY